MELRSGRFVRRSTDTRVWPTQLPDFIPQLPEELVEKIVALVPFPQILKVRVLSKSWHAKFLPISSQADDEKRFFAKSFQKRVCESSDRWKILCPTFLFENFIISFDYPSHRWRKVSALSVLGRRELTKLKNLLPRHHRMFFWNMAGSLLFITTSVPDVMFVVNIFTASWKVLPAPPSMDHRFGARRRLVPCEDMYKVIRLYDVVGCVCASIYDSKSGAWRIKRLKVRDDFQVGLWNTYRDGIMYVIIYFQQMVWGFLLFDVKEEAFHLVQMPPIPVPSIAFADIVQPVACNGTVYIVLVNHGRGVNLLEADLVSRKWSKSIRTPPTLECGFLWGNASTDGDSIFLEGERIYPRRRRVGTADRKILAYDVREQCWNYFVMNRSLQKSLHLSKNLKLDISFQPGMNPFLQP